MDRPNERTQELLERLLDRVARLEEHVKRLEITAALVADEPKLPVDPKSVNHAFENNRQKMRRLIPMKSDEMIFELDQYLTDSALDASDKRAPDRVCFTFFLN